jgi:MFS family permease
MRRWAQVTNSRGTATAILVVLTAINFVNYLDRYVVSAVLEPMKIELQLGDGQAGLLATVFMVVYMLASPISGHFGDRLNRHRIAAVGIGLWSLATIGSGLAEDYAGLLTMRAAVGIGEAGYATVAPSVIADLFRPSERGRKLSYFYLAVPMGSALGYLVGGWVGAEYGWRSAFFVAGAPGIILAVVAWFLPEPARGAMDDEAPAPALPVRAALRRVWASPAWRLNTAGTTLMTFALGGLAFWMPTFLLRQFDLPLGEANFAFGSLTVVAGLIGTLLGGWLGDRAYARGAGGYFRVSGWGLLLGAPVAALLPWMGTATLVYVFAFAAELLLFLNTGPLNAALVACVPAALRARAVAINVLVIHALGDAVSPWLIGLLSEAASLRVAVGSTAVPIAIGGALLWWGARAVDRRPDGLMAVDGPSGSDVGLAEDDAP